MQSTKHFIAIVLLGLAMFVAAVAFLAWLIMLIWGALGEYFDFKTIPYFVAVLISCGLALLGTFINGGKK